MLEAAPEARPAFIYFYRHVLMFLLDPTAFSLPYCQVSCQFVILCSMCLCWFGLSACPFVVLSTTCLAVCRCLADTMLPSAAAGAGAGAAFRTLSPQMLQSPPPDLSSSVLTAVGGPLADLTVGLPVNPLPPAPGPRDPSVPHAPKRPMTLSPAEVKVRRFRCMFVYVRVLCVCVVCLCCVCVVYSVSRVLRAALLGALGDISPCLL